MTMKMMTCAKHGEVKFYGDGRKNSYRCGKCASERVTKTRRKHRAILVEEHGGCCRLCGYNKSHWALHFHHIDPTTKSFKLSGAMQTASLDKLRAEAAKCILLCSNCHAEVEHGVTTIAPACGSGRGSSKPF